jgi:BlaI family transcriptional regulator, penicillinase repressor
MGESSFTDRELDVMHVLWRRGSGTAAEVRAELAAELAYTTVLTVLRILEDKGYVRHEEEGRSHRFYPEVGREEARESALKRLVQRVFDGSAELLMTRLVEQRGLEREELERLRELLNERLGEGGTP